jgi:hypothetical protein
MPRFRPSHTKRPAHVSRADDTDAQWTRLRLRSIRLCGESRNGAERNQRYNGGGE